MQRYGNPHGPIACLNPACDGLRNQRWGSTLVSVFEQEIGKFSDFDYKMFEISHA